MLDSDEQRELFFSLILDRLHTPVHMDKFALDYESLNHKLFFAAMHFYLLKMRLVLESGGGSGEEDFIQDFLIDEIHKMGRTFF